MAIRLSVVAILGLLAAGLAVSLAAAPPASPASPPDEADGLGENAACYVCHMTFVQEELAKKHLAEKIGCVKCHGLSAKHANDENIGATKPDITYKRSEVDRSCRKCHDKHDAPAQAVIGRLLERRLPASSPPICTDCHGSHKIERSAPSSAPLAPREGRTMRYDPR